MSHWMLLFWLSLGLIAYTYGLFPLLLALLARLFPKRGQLLLDPEQSDADLPPVTMVVAAFNEAGVLREKLANTWAIDYPADRLTLLIGSDGSDDDTNEILRSPADPRLQPRLFPQRRGKISVLNELTSEAKDEILVMSDANTMFAPDAVRRLVRPFQDRRVGCVSGELSLENDGGVSGEGLYWKYEGWIKRNESRLGFLVGCNGGIFAIRKELFDPLPPNTIIEDFVTCLRVLERGYMVHFVPEARATEPACPSARAEMIRKIRIGAGGFQALDLNRRMLHPRYGLRAFAFWGHKVIRWFVPLLLGLMLLSCTALAADPLYRALLVAQALGIATACAAFRMGSGFQMPRWTRPLTYFYLMNYALLCGLVRFLFRTQRVTWDRAAR